MKGKQTNLIIDKARSRILCRLSINPSSQAVGRVLEAVLCIMDDMQSEIDELMEGESHE